MFSFRNPGGRGKWSVRIEDLIEGDVVVSAIGNNKVVATCSHYAESLARVHFSDGTSIDCTPNHRFLTSHGWVNAIDIPPQTVVYSTHETMRILREGFAKIQKPFLRQELQAPDMEEAVQTMRRGLYSERGTNDFLFQVLRSEMEDDAAGYCSANDQREGFGCGRAGYQQRDTKEPKRTFAAFDSSEEEFGRKQGLEALQFFNSHKVGAGVVVGLSRSGSQSDGSNRSEFQEGQEGSLLQDRRSMAPSDARSGSGRSPTRPTGTKKDRLGKGVVLGIKRVDCVEILDPSSDARYDVRNGGYLVHNIEVEGHPSYSVNGCVVHNCGIKQKRMRLIADEAQQMGGSFLSAFANLDGNEDFRAIILGNPNEPTDPLGKAAEPKDGWTNHMAPTKTEVWETKFMNGRCVNLVGTDSPNFDFPSDEPTRFKYLISAEKIANTLSFFPKDSVEYYSNCVGVMKVGILSRRVITKDMCFQFDAFKGPRLGRLTQNQNHGPGRRLQRRPMCSWSR